MWKRQKKLIEILNKECLIDKELKFGCICYFPENQEYDKMIEYNPKEWHKILTTYRFHKYSRSHCFSTLSPTWEVIGQYYLWSILQRFDKIINSPLFYGWIGGDWLLLIHEEFFHWEWCSETHSKIKLDMTRPTMERSEDQYKELVEFMEVILSSNDKNGRKD